MAHPSEATRRIAAPIDIVWGAVTTVPDYPHWVHEVGAVHVMERTPQGLPRLARLSFIAGLVRDEVELAYAYEVGEARRRMSWSLVRAQHVTALTGSYTLVPLDPSSTEVSYGVEVEPNIPVHSALKAKVSARIVVAALEALERHVTQG